MRTFKKGDRVKVVGFVRNQEGGTVYLSGVKLTVVSGDPYVGDTSCFTCISPTGVLYTVTCPNIIRLKPPAPRQEVWINRYEGGIFGGYYSSSEQEAKGNVATGFKATQVKFIEARKEKNK